VLIVNSYVFHFVSVKEKLAVDLDSEIATTSLRISLICPVKNSGARRLMLS